MKAEVITHPDALRDIEAAWWSLWSRQTNPTPFTSPAWLIPWWLAFAPGDLLCIAVWRERSLVALAPLYRERGAPARRLLPLGIGVSDYSDILVDPDCRMAAARELTGCLEDGIEDWDLWSAEEASPEAAVLQVTLPLGWRDEREAQSVCPVISLSDGSHDPAAVVPTSMRRKWRMAGHRLNRRTHGFEVAHPENIGRLLRDLFSLHESRWRSRGQGGVLLDLRVRQFHEAAAPRLLDAGMLRLRALMIEGRVAGVYYGMQHGRTAYAYLGGFDPEFGFESPGTVLIGAALEDAMRSGCRAFDFLRGQEPYKFAWGATARNNTKRAFWRVGR